MSTSSTERLLENELKTKKWKYIYFFLNTSLLIIAITQICLMISLEGYWDEFKPFLARYSTINGFNVMFAAGSCVSMTVFGYIVLYIGGYRQFLWYSVTAALTIVLDVRLIIVGLINGNPIRQKVADIMYSAIENYHNSSYYNLRTGIDNVQVHLKCCGVHSPDDWIKYSFHKFIPQSCCYFGSNREYDFSLREEEYENCTTLQEKNSMHIYENSCYNLLVQMPELGMILIYCFVTILICLKLLNILAISTLVKKLKQIE